MMERCDCVEIRVFAKGEGSVWQNESAVKDELSVWGSVHVRWRKEE